MSIGVVEVLEDAVEERERGLHVERDAEQRADREEEARLQGGEGDHACRCEIAPAKWPAKR